MNLWTSYNRTSENWYENFPSIAGTDLTHFQGEFHDILEVFILVYMKAQNPAPCAIPVWHKIIPAVMMLKGGGNKAKPQLQSAKQLIAFFWTYI